MAQVAFEHVRKVYPDGTVAVQDLSLEIADGDLMVLVGPSGCGKTTALRMVAGLEEITSGEVRIGDAVVNELPPRDRDVAMVFQNYALYPHKSVYENLAFPLKLRGLSKSEVEKRVKGIARVLELDEQLPRRPRQLSGGQRQRVAMGRALIREPHAFLMDEPLSNLDAKLRTQMRAEISLLHKELAVTTIYVTHDQVEAMTLGQRVAVLRKGELQQVADPQELYTRPSNLFVAGFIGSPAMNFFEGRVEHADGTTSVAFGDGQRLAVDESEQNLAGGIVGDGGRRVVVGVRPEHLEDAALAAATPTNRRLRGLVRLRELLGSEVVVHFEVEAAPVVTEETRDLAEDVDASVLTELDHLRAARRTAFVGRFSAEAPTQEGTVAEIAVSPGALRFFDPETGERIGA
ncbi:MAG TPA: sn-glycerol-3-phosphate ABC transporter ATP-binding protein UgpC [Gaiellaceae bacterium]|nr:sn-glycerol-3-phosphate ABC transporter ATP-binding protein UgpC [Gaiellaceae bacterium]